MDRKSLLVVAAIAVLAAVPAAAQQSEDVTTAPMGSGPAPDPNAPVWSGPRALLYDNGPIVNSPGTGAGGADESQLQVGLGMNTLGAGHQFALGYRVADEFTVPAGDEWQIDTFTFFAYQTGSTTTSTITGVYVQIWNGQPNAGGTLIWGDMTTNRLSSTSWANIYRVSETASGNTQRPVMANIATIGTSLTPGTYWIDWSVDGTLSSGPWVPPITITGQTSTGNSLQYTTAWAALLDSGTSTPQGLPFIVDGEYLGPTPTQGVLQGIPTMSGRGIAVLVLLLVVVGVLVLRRVS
jgi:hypothetical protein